MSKLAVCLVLIVCVSAFSFAPIRSMTPARVITSRAQASMVDFQPFSGPKVQTDMSLSSSKAADAAVSMQSAEPEGILKTLKVGGFFALWYALNIGYNIYNKRVLNMVPSLVWTVALLQLFVGLLYVLPAWAVGFRKTPELSEKEIKALLPVAVTHLLTHVGAIISLGAGAVSFTHIVKAAEPAVSAGLSAVFLKSFLPWQVSLTLLPVMGGVALASLTELSFSWTSFIAAMVSNVASASRGIVGKMTMGSNAPGKNMDASNLYAVMTILSTLMLAPVSLALEGKNIGPVLTAVEAAGNTKTLLIEALLSCVFYYAYNEVAFLTLDKVAPVTHALGNTIKRVVIILTSIVVFGTKMTTQGAVGSAIAITGVLLYSLAKNTYK